LKPLWPEDKPHLAISEIADWFAAYVYLPKLRDRVVLETAIRDAVGKLDPAFGYADRYDEATASYAGLIVAKSPPVLLAPSAVIIRVDVAFEHTKKTALRQGSTRTVVGIEKSAPVPVRVRNRPHRSSRAASMAQSRSTWCGRSSHST
jgi:hypothetical protein